MSKLATKPRIVQHTSEKTKQNGFAESAFFNAEYNLLNVFKCKQLFGQEWLLSLGSVCY